MLKSLIFAACATCLVACGGSTSAEGGDSGGSGGASNAGGGGGGGLGLGGGSSGGGGVSAGGTAGASSTLGTGGGVAADFAGTWKGYVENYAFDDGTDVVEMQLDSTQAGVSGHIRFGTKALIPPPTNPNVGYPSEPTNGPQPIAPEVVSGFSYEILDGSFDGKRLQFVVAAKALWKSWCEMQSPVKDDLNVGGYKCVPNWSGHAGSDGCYLTNPDTNQDVKYDCGVLSLCQYICDCTASACSTILYGDAKFDMQLVPPAGDGSVAGLGGSVHNVHLVRQ